jgi:hypothetical protein
LQNVFEFTPDKPAPDAPTHQSAAKTKEPQTPLTPTYRRNDQYYKKLGPTN